jgi:hypothetical protein
MRGVMTDAKLAFEEITKRYILANAIKMAYAEFFHWHHCFKKVGGTTIHFSKACDLRLDTRYPLLNALTVNRSNVHWL